MITEGYTPIRFKQLETGRILLRKFRKSDSGFMLRLFSDKETNRFLNPPAIRNRQDAENFLLRYDIGIKNNNLISWCVILKEIRKPVGFIGLYHIDKVHCYASFGSALLKEYHNRGIMTEAHRLVIDFAFTHTSLNRLESQYYEKNHAAEKMLEKSGMKREALLRENFLIDGKFCNSVMYSVIRKDYMENRRFFSETE